MNLFTCFYLENFFVTKASWQNRETNLKKADLKYVEAQTDLIDEIWPADERSPKPSTPIEIHDLKYAGLRKLSRK